MIPVRPTGQADPRPRCEKLCGDSQRTWTESFQAYGVCKVLQRLLRERVAVALHGDKASAVLGLKGVVRARSVRTRISGQTRPCAQTYVPIWAGYLYLAVVTDVWSRRVVGWALGKGHGVRSGAGARRDYRAMQAANVVRHSKCLEDATCQPHYVAATVLRAQSELVAVPQPLACSSILPAERGRAGKGHWRTTAPPTCRPWRRALWYPEGHSGDLRSTRVPRDPVG